MPSSSAASGGRHAPSNLRPRHRSVSLAGMVADILMVQQVRRASGIAPRRGGGSSPPKPLQALSVEIWTFPQSRAMYPNVRSLRSNVRSFLANVRSSPANVRSSASNRSQELRTSTRHRVTARTVGERAPARPLAHQKPFPDRAVKSHGDVVRVLCRHLVEPAFTHPPEEGDDQHLRENPTLTDATHHRLR